MKSMIYYPGFEIEDETWLKFSLLYFDELRPIIPQLYLDRSQYLSKNAIRIMDNTDLIAPYCPESDESMIASITACEEFRKYLEHPELYFSLFSGKNGTTMIERWRCPEQQNTCLYAGKFSYVFYDFCVGEGIATPVDGGVRISKDLAYVYMSFLADVISKKQSYEMFTDIRRYDNLLQYNDEYLVCQNRATYEKIKKYTEFYIPANLNKIPLDVIIDLRNERNFNECRKAYVHEIEEFLKYRENNLEYSLQEQLEIGRDVKRILKNVFGSVAGAYILFNEVAPVLDNEITPVAALAMLAESVINYQDKRTKQYFNELKTKIQAKRYVGTIKRVSNRNGRRINV